jgi:hypothetical protein
MKGEVVVERKIYNTPKLCEELGEKRIEALYEDPDFEKGYFAACIATKVRET